MIKSLLVFIFLSIWTAVGDSAPCAVFAIYLLLISTFLTIALSEIKIVKNSVIANSIFHSDTFIFRIVKSTKFALLLSLIISFVSAVVILVWLLHMDYILLVILGLDALVIWGIYSYTRGVLSSRVKSEFLDAVSRRWAGWVNTALLMVAFILYQFFSTPSMSIELISCDILEFLSSSLQHKEILEYRATSLLLGSLGGYGSLVGWILYLMLSQSLFAWAYSRLLLSIDVPAQRMSYFVMGFVGAIVMLVLSTMIVEYLHEKQRIKKSQIYIDRVYHEIDSRITAELSSGEQRLVDDIDKIIDIKIDRAFESVYGGIPALSEYYYSIQGEYTRLALKGRDLYCGYKNSTIVPFYNKLLPTAYQLEKCNEQMLDTEVASRVNKYLFVDNNFSTDIDNASLSVNRAISDMMSDFHHQLNSSVNSVEDSSQPQYKAIDSRLAELNGRFDEVFKATSRDMIKKGFSGTGAVLLTTTISKTIMSKMLLKLGAKSAGKAATFVAGTTTGLGICAPTGPWALLCGVATGTASWIGVDAALTEVDQAFNQKSFQLSTRGMIDAEKHTLKALTKDSYHAWIVEVFAELRNSSKSLKSPYKQWVD